jgi:hypothetical protein
LFNGYNGILAKGGDADMRLHIIQGLLPALIIVIILASCSSLRTTTVTPVSTLKPAVTSASIPQQATIVPELIDITRGGFTLTIQPGLAFEAHEDSISISDKQGEFIVSLNGRPYIASSYTLQSFLGKYLSEMETRGGDFDQGQPYEIVVDGKNGLAIDFSGHFLDNPIAGKAIAVSPGRDFIIFGLGMSLLNLHQNGWAESGSTNFETILHSIHFKDEVK